MSGDNCIYLRELLCGLIDLISGKDLESSSAWSECCVIESLLIMLSRVHFLSCSCVHSVVRLAAVRNSEVRVQNVYLGEKIKAKGRYDPNYYANKKALNIF